MPGESAVVGVISKVMAVTGFSSLGASACEWLGLTSKEAVEGNDPNVVSQGLDAIISGMDAVGDAVADVRDNAGEAIHDTLSNVPVIGGLLGGITDVAGTAVDIVGGVWSEAMSTIGCVQKVSNVAGATLFGASYVDSEAEAVAGLSEEEAATASAQEKIRSGGIGGVIDVIFDAGANVVDFITGGSEEEASSWVDAFGEAYENGEISDNDAAFIIEMYDNGTLTDDDLNTLTSAISGGELSWSDFTSLFDDSVQFQESDVSSEDVPIWLQSLTSDLESGSLSESQATNILAAYQYGYVDDAVLNDYYTSVASGQTNWNILGSNFGQLFATLQTEEATSSNDLDTALISMDNAAMSQASSSKSEPVLEVTEPSDSLSL